jgi:hypothetical protein
MWKLLVLGGKTYGEGLKEEIGAIRREKLLLTPP